MPRPLRVAHLTTVDMSLALLLATELAEDVAAGFETYGISAPGPYVEEVEALGVQHVALPSFTRSWNVARDLTAARELWRALRRLDLEVLHTHTPKAGVLGRILGRLTRVPVVVNTCHGLWVRPEDGLAKKIFVYGSEALAAQFSHAELYQNDEDRQRLSWAVPRRRARTVGNGIDLQHFRPDPDGRARVRAELGLSDDDVLVGGVGRQVAEKGILEFATAARALGDRATFVWVGPDDPDKPDRLQELDDAIHFLGLRRDMTAVYSALDVFVLPSYREGFSRSAMEAAACGCALVLSDIRGCREIGTHGEHLLLVPARDAEALTHTLHRLVIDAAQRSRLAAAAEQRAADTFDQRKIAAISIATYAAVARRRGLPWPEVSTPAGEAAA